MISEPSYTRYPQYPDIRGYRRFLRNFSDSESTMLDLLKLQKATQNIISEPSYSRYTQYPDIHF